MYIQTSPKRKYSSIQPILKSVYSDRLNDTRNYFGPDFRKVLYEVSGETWNLYQAQSSIKFARTAGEIDRVFISFFSAFLGGFENKNNPADKLAGYLLETFANFFELFDTDAKKVVLYHENKLKFEKVI